MCDGNVIKARMLVMTVVLISLSYSAHAALLQLNLEGESFKSSAIDVNRKFSGFSGYIIDLPDGQHEVRFSTKKGGGFWYECRLPRNRFLLNQRLMRHRIVNNRWKLIGKNPSSTRQRTLEGSLR